MIYPFRCPSCEHYTEVVRPHTESGAPEFCEKCKTRMVRVYTLPQVSIPMMGYYDYGLGTYIGSKQDKKDAIRRINDRGDVQVEEVGDQKIKPKPARKDIDLPNELIDRIYKPD